MIIGIDGTCLQGPQGEVGHYLTHLLEAMSHLLEEDKIYVWMNSPTSEEKARVSENRFVSVAASHYPWAALRMTWTTLGTPTMDSLIGRPPDVCFYPNYLALPQKHGKKVIFVHDVLCFTHPEWVSEDWMKALEGKLGKQGEQADLILTSSEYNRQVLLKHLPGIPEARVRVIYHGLAESFRKPAPPDKVKAARERYLLHHPYFLYTGPLEPSKNLLRLVHAFLLFKKTVATEHELVLAGPRGKVGDDFVDFIQSPVLANKARWLSNVPVGDLPALYTGAEAFVFPCMGEGFGMPVLEAMGCGTPVLCSTQAALPEIVGDSAWMISPTSVADWAKALERVVKEPAFKEVLREKGRVRVSIFREENTAQQTLSALKMAAHGHA